MVNKFQSRLVGTIILITLGIIILPCLLDGKKKCYQDEFVAIPLVSKSGATSNELYAASRASQQLPRQLLGREGGTAEQLIRSANSSQSPVLPINATHGSHQLETLVPPAANMSVKPDSKLVGWPENKSIPKSPTVKFKNWLVTEQAAKRQVWVVQLGALKNADKVSEIVAKLWLSGYLVYTLPAAPVHGQITRIFVGPDASREKLQSVLGELNQLSGLNGQLRPYIIR